MVESHREEHENKKKSEKRLNHEHYEKQVMKNKVELEMKELKSLVEQGLVDKELFDKVKEDNSVSVEEFQEILGQLNIQELFDKLEEIEKTKDIEKILPKSVRVSKEEYLRAFQNPQVKQSVLLKFDASLDIIYQNVSGRGAFKGNLFGTYTYLLSQKLIPLQENIIDLKISLTSGK